MKLGEIYDSLSPIRRQVYDYVRKVEEDTGEGARIRDIARSVGLSSSNTYFHVGTLIDLGLLYQDDKKHVRVVGAVVFVHMPDESIEIVGADRLDKYNKKRK